MIPTSLSATALQTYSNCPARFKAEVLQKTKGFGGNAAMTGSAVHGALEHYVKRVQIEQAEAPSEKLLLDLFKLSYIDVFNTFDTSTVEFMDGYDLCQKWYARTSFEGRRVISCELKSFFDVPTTAGNIPFNYIWDRFDQTDEKVFKVVDYKTNRWNITHNDLKKKIQARAYALACAIQLKTQNVPYDRIWVEFDMLRHEPLAVSFNYEDIVSTWNYIKDSAQEIVDRPEDAFEERLNPECLFCVRKAGCDALKKNLNVGGIHSIDSIEKAINLRAELEWQKKGLESLIGDIDNKILTEAKERDLEAFESDMATMRIGVPTQRRVDAERVQMAIGDKLFAKYGGASFSISNVDKLLKGKELTDEQKAALRSVIYIHRGEPRVKIEAKGKIE